MTSMWKRGSQCHYPGTSIVAAHSSDLSVRPDSARLTSTGSPP
jgi:hypothetical protein